MLLCMASGVPVGSSRKLASPLAAPAGTAHRVRAASATLAPAPPGGLLLVTLR